MKKRNIIQRVANQSHALTAVALLACTAVFTHPTTVLAGKGNQDNPGVVPPQATPNDHTYGEWAAMWWQWALSIPADRNPLLDTTGEFAGESQRGPVWFVAGTFSSTVERSYTVPSGKALFIPVFVWIFGSGVFDCEPTIPGVTCDVPTLQATAAMNTEAAEVLEVTIDGVPVQNLRQYRGASPGGFSVVYPENSVVNAAFGVDLPAGTYTPQVTDGYWLMLTPLRKGTHEIHLRASASVTSNGSISFDVLHHITVK